MEAPIKDIIHSHLKSIADDKHATKSIKSLFDVTILQKELDVIYKWTHENNIELNDVKFEFLFYGPNQTMKYQSNSPSGKIIKTKDVVKNLVMLVMEMSIQIDGIVKYQINKSMNTAPFYGVPVLSISFKDTRRHSKIIVITQSNQSK